MTLVVAIAAYFLVTRLRNPKAHELKPKDHFPGLNIRRMMLPQPSGGACQDHCQVKKIGCTPTKYRVRASQFLAV